MGVYMGVFNFFIVIPEILASVGFGPLIRLAFGESNPNAPLYVVVAGGVCLLLAAASVALVQDLGRPGARLAPLAGEAAELLLVQESAQPVPSSGLPDSG